MAKNKGNMSFSSTNKLSIKDAWLNIFYVFGRDFKRILLNPIATGVILFVLVFPCLYAWIGTHAYWDPYSNTQGLSIAVVNEDKPADTGIAGEINLGQMICDELEKMPLLGWDFTNRDNAMQKLDSGEVYAALVIPENFSEGFAKLFNDSKNRTNVHFDYYINERENGAASKIFDIGGSTIEGKINEKFIETVSQVLAEKAHSATGDIANTASNSASAISGKVDSAADSINRLNSLFDEGQVTMAQTKSTIGQSKLLVADIKQEANQVLTTIDSARTTITNLRGRVHTAIADLEKLGLDLHVVKEILTNLEHSIDNEIEALDKISPLMYKIDSTCNELNSLITQIESMLKQTDSLGDYVHQKTQGVYDKLHELSNTIDGDIAAAPFAVKAILDSNTENLGTFMSVPVQMDKQIIGEVSLYGMGAAPFFTNLTLWIAGLVLIALLRTEVDPPKRKGWNARQAYISRGLLFALVSILTGIVCAIGEFIIGVTPQSPLMYVVTCVLISFTYASIIYMLAACFKHVGKAIAVILIIMQIPGASGMFPVAMMPLCYQILSPFLPFTYGIAGLREAVVSPQIFAWLGDIFALMIFVFLSLIVGVYAREHLTSINKLFDKKLAKTGLMECDARDHLVEKKSSFNDLIEELADTKYEAGLAQSLTSLKKKYKKKTKRALVILWTVPLIMLAVLSLIFYFVEVDINTKIAFLLLWLLIIVICCSYVIVLEFKYTRFKKESKGPLTKGVKQDTDKIISQNNFDMHYERFLVE